MLIYGGWIDLPHLLRVTSLLACEGESERADFAELGYMGTYLCMVISWVCYGVLGVESRGRML